MTSLAETLQTLFTLEDIDDTVVRDVEGQIARTVEPIGVYDGYGSLGGACGKIHTFFF